MNIDVSNHSVNAQQTNYVRKSISSVRSSEIKAMIQLGLNTLVLISSFAILDRRIAVNGRETCDRTIFLLNTTVAAKSYGTISIWRPSAIFSILAIFSIFRRIRNKRVIINHKNTFKMSKNMTIVLANLRDFHLLQ